MTEKTWKGLDGGGERAFEYAVGLSPVPFMADPLGQSSTALIGIVGDELTEKVNLVGGYGTFAVCEYLDHVENITGKAMDPTFI